jgi:hypothetical protein
MKSRHGHDQDFLEFIGEMMSLIKSSIRNTDLAWAAP